MRHLVSFICIVGCVALSGCSLEEGVSWGEKCPEKISFIYNNDGDLEYSNFEELKRLDGNGVDSGVKDAISKNACPEKEQKCYRNSSEKYYCRIACPQGQVSINGRCTDPGQSADYCGAKGDYHISKKVEEVKYSVEEILGNNCNRLKMTCTNGACECLEGQVKCDGECIVPNSDPKHCGASGKCNSEDEKSPNYQGSDCDTGQCKNGECWIDPASQDCGDLAYCYGECVDLKFDLEHCGSCGRRCENYAPLNAETIGCEDKACLYRCKEGYDNCGTDEKIECISHDDMLDDENNCGGCHLVCDVNEICLEGKCEESPCENNQCQSKEMGECVNSDEECGTGCKNCQNMANVEQAECKNGVCRIVSCEKGFHISVPEDGDELCVQNQPNSCAAPNSQNAVDCTMFEIPNSAVNVCSSDGICIAEQCNDTSIKVDGNCVGNTVDNCGGQSCYTLIPNSDKVSCDNGVCVASGCNDGYHLVGNHKCEEDSKAACGEAAVECASYMACIDGECTCGKGNHDTGSSCEPNSNENCGQHGKTCKKASDINNGGSQNGVSSVSCNSETGLCEATDCRMGRHLCEGQCLDAFNTIEHCGSCTNQCGGGVGAACKKGILSGYECNCGKGYELCGASCVDVDSNESNCGGCDIVCSTEVVEHSTEVKCQEATCKARSCEAGFGVCKGKCVDLSSNSHCGACGNSCPSHSSCVGGVCQCDQGYNNCNGVCRNLQTEDLFCGSCNYSCGLITETCSAGKCVCASGFVSCNDSCVSLSSNRSNCGSCGNSCGSGETCSGGKCVCMIGYQSCNGVCVSTSSPYNCGGCGIVCTAEARGAESATCLAGVCIMVCGDGKSEKNGYCVSDE